MTKKATKAAKTKVPAKTGKAGPPAVKEAKRGGALARYGRREIDLIKKNVAKGASDVELEHFLYVCQHTGLNPLLGQIYSIKRREWDHEKLNPETGKKGDWGYKQSIQLGIDGLRLIAQRTGQYAGQRGPQWCGKDGKWASVWLDTKSHPAAARVGIMRQGFTDPVWGIALWAEYVQTKRDKTPTAMWKNKGALMLAKCAESQGLRKAFPAELSGLYTFEEMQTEHPESVQATPDELEEIKMKVQRVMMLAKQTINPKTKKCYTDKEIHAELEQKHGVSSFKSLSLAQLDKTIEQLEDNLRVQEAAAQPSGGKKAEKVAGGKPAEKGGA
jgi:phage recombination protein Bet